MSKRDPVCAFHGKRWSEHECLVCCICFKDLTVEGCYDGQDICEECGKNEAIFARQGG